MSQIFHVTTETLLKLNNDNQTRWLHSISRKNWGVSKK